MTLSLRDGEGVDPPDPAARTPESAGESFKPVRQGGPTQQVREQLLAAIERGDFPPGSMLPSERMLCETFGVSRVSVREAISGLEAVGLIRVQHGRGMFVVGVAGHYAGQFARYLELHRDQLLELLNVQGALDELAAREAASHGSVEGIARLVDVCDAFRSAVDQDDGLTFTRLAELDFAFHVSIAKCCTGELLPRLLTDLHGLLEESRRLSLATQGRPTRSVAGHQAIVDAIVAHDAPAARRAAARHVRENRSSIAKFAKFAK